MSETWVDYLKSKIPPATDADRAIIEQQIGNRLPDDYWEMASIHQGCYRKPEGVVLANGERIVMGVLLIVIQNYELPEPVGGYELLDTYEHIEQYYPAGIVPFSDDTNGNYLAFDFRNPGEPSIVFVNHEIEGEDGLTWVAPNFAALIAGLIEFPDD